MKKYLLIPFFLVLTVILVSWGTDGHEAVAKIAEVHLTPNAKQAVKHLLGTESMANVSNFADDIKANRAFSATAVLHYIDLPLGYNFEQFSSAVKSSPGGNVYNGIIGAIGDLENPAKNRAQKSFALKFLIHLIGDCHQPMHVSRAEDKGGNAIPVVFLGVNNNLHGLWDYGLIDHLHLNYKEMAKKFDDATPEQIKKWQSDDIMIWLWESYQVSTILYQEAADNNNFDEKYYEAHLPVIKSRIERAGIRLAGVLNAIYK